MSLDDAKGVHMEWIRADLKEVRDLAAGTAEDLSKHILDEVAAKAQVERAMDKLSATQDKMQLLLYVAIAATVGSPLVPKLLQLLGV